jgi:hypothetical protein
MAKDLTTTKRRKRREAAEPAVADGRARRSLRSLSRPPLNGCIVRRLGTSQRRATNSRASIPMSCAIFRRRDGEMSRP